MYNYCIRLPYQEFQMLMYLISDIASLPALKHIFQIYVVHCGKGHIKTSSFHVAVCEKADLFTPTSSLTGSKVWNPGLEVYVYSL